MNVEFDSLAEQEDLIELHRELGKRSMYQFVKLVWDIIEPSTPYIDNWHLQAICEHLEAAVRGEIKKLAISIPSRHFKSGLTSVCMLPWVWTWNPGYRGIFASYNDDLSVRDSIKARTIIESSWYKAVFSGPDNWALREDRNKQNVFATSKGGHRMALSVGGRSTGEGGNCVVCDDPQGIEGPCNVYSKAEREKVNRWWFEAMSTRIDDPSKALFIVMQQRLSKLDLIGEAIARDLGYEYLCIPSEFVSSKRCITYRVDPATGQREKFWEDPRETDGELLYPQRFPQDYLNDAKKTLGSVAYQAQHQQDPVATSDSVFKPDWWRFWKPEGRRAEGKVQRPAGCSEAEAVPLPEKFDKMVITSDCTLLGEQSTDWTVIQVWGGLKMDRYLLEQIRGKIPFPRMIDIFKDLRVRYPHARILIEESVVGPAAVAELRQSISNVFGVKTQGHGGKEGRAASITPQVENGNVFLPEGASWLDLFVAEHMEFPKSRHDDMVDCTSFALREMSSGIASGGGIPRPLIASVDLWPNRGLSQTSSNRPGAMGLSGRRGRGQVQGYTGATPFHRRFR